MPPPVTKFKAIVAFGSNLGNRQQTIACGFDHIAHDSLQILARSPLYETPPMGGAADQPFINGAILVETELSPQELLKYLLAVEQSLGRVRERPWGNRTLDLDIILMVNEAQTPMIVREPGLILPHPESLKRDFVLVPAADIAPDWIHPETGHTLKEEVQRRGYHLIPEEPSPSLPTSSP